LIKHFCNSNNKTRLDILIIRGLEGSDDRITGFIARLDEYEESNKKFSYKLHDEAEWNGNYPDSVTLTPIN
jgi:hypothetical protein